MWKRFAFVLVLILAFHVPPNLGAEEVAKSLPPNELAKYCDPFDKFREDLWERQQMLLNEAQTANFKRAEIAAQGGKLKFETHTGAFSKAALHSKFFLQGDFDVQIDCSFQFLKKELKMDQRVNVGVMETGKEAWKSFGSLFVLVKEGTGDGSLFAMTQAYGKRNPSGKRSLQAFQGTLRIVRKGKTLILLCRDKGSPEWKEMLSSSCPETPMSFAMMLANHTPDRRSITADEVISVTFENFKINAAQGIKESDI